MTLDADSLFVKQAGEKGFVTPQQVAQSMAAQQAARKVGVEKTLSEILLTKHLLNGAQIRQVHSQMLAQGVHPTLGDFELVAELGFGAMGTAYRARRVSTDETVALRVLPFEVDKDKAFLDRLMRRTHAAGRLSHPHIAEDWHLAQAEGFHLIVAELMDGGSLRARIRKERKLPEAEALRIGIQVAEALDYLHASHLFHGAVKPSNILFTADTVAKLADVGLARSYDVSSEHSKSPLESFVYGAPDQFEEPKRDLDIRTDIYQLGTTLYHALCGTPPFVAQTPVQLIARHLQITPPSPKEHAPELSDATCRMLLKMLEKDPAKRYQTPAELLKDLRQILRPAPASLGQTDARVKRRQLLTLVGACCLAAAISGFSIWYFLIAPKGKAAAQRPAEPPAPDLTPQTRDKPFEAALARVAAYEPPATPDALLVAADGSGKFKTIQAALDAAKPGDVVRVKAGLYRESLRLKSGVFVQGDGPAKSRLEFDGDWVAVHAKEVKDATLDGFTVAYTGRHKLVPIYVFASSVTISNCIVTGGQLSGIEVKANSNPVIRGNVIRGNQDNGVLIWVNSAGEVADNVLCENGLNGIEVKDGSQPHIRGNLIRGNKHNGALVWRNSAGLVRRNVISHNGLSGVEVKENAKPTICHNTVVWNADSGILSGPGGAPVVLCNLIVCNQWGVSPDKERKGKFTLGYNDIWGNKEKNYGWRQARSGQEISVAPQFVNPSEGDYRLKPNSPCLGACDRGQDLGALPHLADLFQQVGDRLAARKFKEALTVCYDSLNQTKDERLRPQIAALKTQVQGSCDVWDAALGRLWTLVGQDVRLKLAAKERVSKRALVEGKLVQIKDELLTVTVAGQATEVALSSVHTEDIARLAGAHLGENKGDTHLKLAFFFLGEGDLAAARQALERAQKLGADVTAVRERLGH